MSRCKLVLLGSLAALAVTAAAVGVVAIRNGWYDVSATHSHTAPIYRVVGYALDRSVSARAAAIEIPDLAEPGRAKRGLQIYEAHCVQCHGAPGVAPQPFAMGLNPAPPPLVASARERPANEIFWMIREGIKMTGMPAWRYRLSDERIWDVVAFMRTLPDLSPMAYQSTVNQTPEWTLADATSASNTAGRTAEDEAGVRAIQQYLCLTCHIVPGGTGPRLHVGPSLEGMADRAYIAGTLPNTLPNMQRWLREPEKIKPGTAMPNLHVTEQDAHDMAEYLMSLKSAD
ncbi:c-type cytochrome [Bordetella sp. 15P40C-2]|uniref:c-type cytochrome n=1 Tax=Bordetella sp. 15P40C-2 TaxID=2572246 RepID=UPI0013280C29|nr:c-type cytochrome [Bordetella sp. 15P40C-2]MVW73221.1 c-type cytochrome [Bordetella sp. 15P40C-2]